MTAPIATDGTVTVIDVLDQAEMAAAVEPKLTVLCEAAKLLPAITTVLPTAPEAGVTEVMLGAATV